MHIYGASVGLPAALLVDVDLLVVVVAGLLVGVVIAVVVGRRVLVLLTLLYVLVGVSGTATVGSLPTVISALPLPCWPSMPMTM
jgi:hypothetical protein